MKIDFVKRLCICSLPLFLLFLPGCCRILYQQDATGYRVVSQVDITYQNENLRAHRQFLQQDKIQQILTYLRLLDPYGVPLGDPEEVTGREYEIQVLYSDGSRRVYHQRADRYFRTEGGPWKRIDPQKALLLGGLFGMMPSDRSASGEETPPPLLRQRI